MSKDTVFILQATAGGAFLMYLISALFFNPFSYAIVAAPIVIGAIVSSVTSAVGVALVFDSPINSSVAFSSSYVAWALFASTTGIGLTSSLFWVLISIIVFGFGIVGGYLGRYFLRDK